MLVIEDDDRNVMVVWRIGRVKKEHYERDFFLASYRPGTFKVASF